MEKTWNDIWNVKKGTTDFEEKWYNFLKKFRNKENVLEVGCGSGRGLKNFRNKITGVDISIESLKRARVELKNKKVKLIKCDAKNLLFKDHVFDMTFSTGLIEHFRNRNKDDEKILDEIVRVTKIGGIVVISVPNKFCIWYIVGKFLLELIGKYPYPDEKPYSIFELERMIKSRDIKNIHTLGLQLFPLSYTGFNKIYPNFLSKIFDKIEGIFSGLNKYFAFDIICWGEV